MQLYVDYLVKVLHFRRVNNPSDVPVKSSNYLASKPLKSHNFLHLCGQIFPPSPTPCGVPVITGELLCTAQPNVRAC